MLVSTELQKRSWKTVCCSGLAVMPGSGSLAKGRVYLSKNRGRWAERKLTGSLDTLGDQRNYPVILLRRKVTGD